LRYALVVIALLGCAKDHPPAAAAGAPHGPIAALMTHHADASCGRSDRTYDPPFFRPPYQTCSTPVADTTESAEIDADSVVVEVVNTWTVTPAAHAGAFSGAEADLIARFGVPRRCSGTADEWRRGDSLHVLLQIAPVSSVGTEFDEGPWRLTRVARLGPLEAAKYGC
jgi:hypothetical protein